MALLRDRADDTTAMGGRVSCIRAACGRSVLVEASAFGWAGGCLNRVGKLTGTVPAR